MANLNEVKVEGTIVSKVTKTELESGLKLANFILKTDGDHPVYVMVKVAGKRPIELEKGQHIWLKGSLANMRRQDGSYEIGISSNGLYKVHEDNQSPYPVKPNLEALDSIQVEDEEPTGFKGVRTTRRKQR